jgi:hypothetical protein
MPNMPEAPDKKKKRGMIYKFTNPKKIKTDSLLTGFFTCQYIGSKKCDV